MSSNESSELTAANLVALRNLPDGLKIITERLNVKQMGPADHIRTKHEVKAFIESAGDPKEAEALVARARTRRALQEAHETTMKVAENQRQGIRP
jgi:hypothetical protein